MTARKRRDVGFNVDTAIQKLLWLLVDEGGIPENDPRIYGTPYSTDPSVNESERRRRRLGELWNVANHHYSRHGLQDAPDYNCPIPNCRALGVSAAMIEIIEFVQELDGPVLRAADAIAKWLQKGKALERALQEFLRVGENPCNTAMAFASADVRVLMLEQSLRNDGFARTEAELRVFLVSAQLRQPKGRRRSDALLSSVYQQLFRRGFTCREIASLWLPFEHGKDEVAEADIGRVHKRLKSGPRRANKGAGWRTHLSREDHPELSGNPR